MRGPTEYSIDCGSGTGGETEAGAQREALLEGQIEIDGADSKELHSNNGDDACTVVERGFGEFLRKGEEVRDFGNRELVG